MMRSESGHLRTVTIFSLLALTLAASVSADIITLKNGQSISGSFYRQGNKYVIEPYNGTSFSVPVTDVIGVVLAPNPNSAQAKGHKWTLLHYEISRSSSLPNIIAMLRQFIVANPHSASLSKAQKSLIKYRQYEKLHLIKLGLHWISRSQLAKIRTKVDRDLRTAIQLYHLGRLSQSLRLADAATRLLPSSVSAWTTKGVIEFRLNHLLVARRDFRTARRLSSHNITALNNSAVINFEIHRQPRALLLFTRALAIDSGNRQVLDNIYAALRAYKGDRRAILFKNLRRSFTSADREMEKRMARRGLYRVGGTWVDAKIYKIMAIKLAVFKQKKQALQASYDSTVLALKSVLEQIRQTDAQITSIKNAIGTLETQQVINAYQYNYYDYGTQAALNVYMANLAQAQSQKLKLENQRIAILAGLASIRTQARALQKSGPGIALSGRQVLLFPRKFQPTPEPLQLPLHPLGHQAGLSINPEKP